MVLQVVSKAACTLCILSGGAQQPAGLADQADCHPEEWLLNAGEQYRLPGAVD